ncbi:MAG: acyl carrier protein [Isosphaeraceae bacterium]
MQPECPVLAEVIDAIRTSAKLGPAIPVTPELRLAEDLAIDSLGLVGLILEIERRFAVVVADDELIGFRTVSDIVAYLSGARRAA